MLTKNHSSTEAISLLANLKFDERKDKSNETVKCG